MAFETLEKDMRAMLNFCNEKGAAGVGSDVVLGWLERLCAYNEINAHQRAVTSHKKSKADMFDLLSCLASQPRGLQILKVESRNAWSVSCGNEILAEESEYWRALHVATATFRDNCDHPSHHQDPDCDYLHLCDRCGEVMDI